MLYPFWLVGLGLVVLLSLSATMSFVLRTRFVVAVSERLERSGREGELKWLMGVREELSLATAIIRIATSLALVLVTLVLCEGYGLVGISRDVASFLATFALVLVFGVAIPAAVAKYATGGVTVAALPAFRVLHVVTRPLLRGLLIVDRIARRLAGVPERSAESEANDAEQEILNVVSEGEIHGAVDEQEKEMIESVMHFDATDVEQIMTPRTDVDAIPKETTFAEAKKKIAECGHSRIPVYDGTIDNILGVLYAKDLLQVDSADGFDTRKIMRSVPYVPNGKAVRELLKEFQEGKIHIAIVLDEYGGTSGLVTIEDILEELVGEIADEYEESEPAPIERIDETTVDVDARMRVAELNEELDLSLPEHEDYETIGGYVFSKMGRIPRVGERCGHGNVEISVIAAETRKINRLRLHVRPLADNDEQSE
ncbi:MAG: HlyC/CorC family transporter [Planctomycetes bacterium]|nr:HlyC/CorC family transporter [Planctomycetota bacterium]